MSGCASYQAAKWVRAFAALCFLLSPALVQANEDTAIVAQRRAAEQRVAQGPGGLQSSTTVGNLSVEQLLSIMNERDKLYRDRFEAMEKAAATREVSQEKAMAAALTAAKEAVNAALTSAKEAVLKAEAASNDRFASVNEFRKTLDDAQKTFAQRSEVDVRIRHLEDAAATRNKAVDDSLSSIINRLNLIQGRDEGATWLWGVIVAAVAVIGALIFGIMNILSRRA